MPKGYELDQNFSIIENAKVSVELTDETRQSVISYTKIYMCLPAFIMFR